MTPPLRDRGTPGFATDCHVRGFRRVLGGEGEFAVQPPDLEDRGSSLQGGVTPAHRGESGDRAFREGIRARRPEAWAQLVALYGPALQRKARLLLPRACDPQDGVAEVWVRALRSAHQYDPDRPPYPWLARICTNACLNQRRSFRAFLPALVTRVLERQEPRDSARFEARAALRRALGELPARQREVVILRFVFEVSVAEIGRLLEINPNSVQQALLRGLERLRKGTSAAELRECWVHLSEEG